MRTSSAFVVFVAVFTTSIFMTRQPAVSAGRIMVQPPGPAPAVTIVPGPVFRRMAMMGDIFEIESSRLALARSRNPAVRQFARRMIADHTATLQAMMAGLASGTDVPLDPRHVAMLAQLQSARGRHFDWLYATMQLQAHQEAVSQFQSYAVAGDRPALVNFARRTLPSLQHHLAMARRLTRRT